MDRRGKNPYYKMILTMSQKNTFARTESSGPGKYRNAEHFLLRTAMLYKIMLRKITYLKEREGSLWLQGASSRNLVFAFQLI